MDYYKLKTKFLLQFSKRFEEIYEEKREIRSEIRGLKKMLTSEEKELAGRTVFTKIEELPIFKIANTILIYWATPDELPTQETIQKWSATKVILLPAINGSKLTLKRYLIEGKLVQKELGIWEPDLTENYEGKVDLVIVPGVCFDKNKNRLGRGKGYYDRFFKKYKPMKIGVGFDFQLMNSVPISKEDIAMDMIITPSKIVQ